MSLKPWDITKLAVGPVRTILAPDTEDVPEAIQDVVDMTAPYANNNSFFDLGAARESSTYTRGMDEEGLQIQQESGDIMSEITDIQRTFKLSVSEIAPDNIKIIENSTTQESIAAASGSSAQVAVPVGSFSDLEVYRLVLIAVRKKQSGVVIEPGGAERGCMVAYFGNRVTLAAEDADFEWEKGQLVNVEVTFKSYPEPGLDDEESYGRWVFEQPGTIA